MPKKLGSQDFVRIIVLSCQNITKNNSLSLSTMSNSERTVLKRSIGNLLTFCWEKLLTDIPELKNKYQKRSKVVGDFVEEFCNFVFKYLTQTSDFEIKKEIKEAAMTGSGAADFVLMRQSRIIAVIEAKGSPAIHMNGSILTGKPGLERTDTFKKAISSAYQIKKAAKKYYGETILSPDVKFYIVTNSIGAGPTVNQLIELSKGDIIDDIFVLSSYDEYARMEKALKKIFQ